MRLRYTQTALRQIADALDHIETRSLQSADGLRGRLRAVARLIEVHPHAGQATDRPGARRVVMTPYPYVLFYRVSPSEIVVTRFRHAARKPLPQ